jgi:DeoR family ulaG and ulaABCDEF operon transcriptional repressor
MHERERWQVIKAMLRERAVVRIADVLKATGASEASVRRDFTKLAETGVAMRVRGGLEPASSSAGESGYVPRTFEASSVLNIEAKRAIARAAVDLNEDGESIIINGGTTTFEMGAYLRDRRLKVLTNSYPLAELLIRDSRCRVALPGGEVYREERLIVSPFDDDATQHYSAARMFMSAISVGELGVIEGHPLVARAERKLLARARELVVLVDSSKFVARGSLVVCPLSRVARVITDSGAPPSALEMLREAGIAVDIVEIRADATAAA